MKIQSMKARNEERNISMSEANRNEKRSEAASKAAESVISKTVNVLK
jgi:predicted Fe-Mo cluster-binding NifX family protein